MLSFFVAGSPIAGEDRRERAWRNEITTTAADAGAPCSRGVSLHFCLEVGRARIDLDNLVRPALDALRDAGVFGRGFRDLDALVAAKAAASPVGLGVALMTVQDVRALAPPGELLLTLESWGLPRDGDRAAKVRWREAIAQAWPHEPLKAVPVGLDIAVNTSLSFKDLLKPIIDGLEPVFGRDPRGHLEFSPNDHLITWLRVLRSPGPPTLRLQLATAD